MGNYFKFIIITAIACLSSLEAHSQLLKSVYNPQVYGDPYGNKTEYYVRMSKENTTIIRAPHSNYSDDFSVYRDAYIVDLSTNIKYRLLDMVSGKYYPDKRSITNYAWVFEPLPVTCSNIRLVDGPLNITINLENANGRKVTHAARNAPSASFTQITNDIEDLISQYYENLGLDENRGIFYMHKISNIKFSKNGNMITISCRTNSDQYNRYREIWFDITQATFIEETAYGTYQGERDKGAQKFIHIKCPSGIFQRDDIGATYPDYSPYIHTYNDYYFHTSIPNLSKQFHNGLLWLKQVTMNSGIVYKGNLNVSPTGVTPVRKNDINKQTQTTNNSSSTYRSPNSTNYSSNNREFRPGNASIVDNTGTHDFTKYNCPSMYVTDYKKSVTISWGGDVVSLPKVSGNTYRMTGSSSKGNLTLTAYRSSQTGRIYLVTAFMRNPSSEVSQITINFKP